MILLVDDTASNIDILIGILGEDFEVAVALCGEDAIEVMEQDIPELVFLDVLMPGISGYEVLNYMKSMERLADVPVVFLSANADAREREKGLASGASAYLGKPIEAEAVLNQARKYSSAGFS